MILPELSTVRGPLCSDLSSRAIARRSEIENQVVESIEGDDLLARAARKGIGSHRLVSVADSSSLGYLRTSRSNWDRFKGR